MSRRLGFFVVILVLVAAVGGTVYLMFANIPPQQTPVEKVLDNGTLVK